MSRAKYCRGFGIQSPWAYRFVRYVVNEHYPYYAYDDLRPLFPHLSKRERRVCELYLRIANHQQADEAVLLGDVSEAKRAYLHAGCLRMAFSSMGEGACSLAEDSFSLAVVAHGQDMEQQVLSLINRATDASLLIVEGIHRNGETRRSWARNENAMTTVAEYNKMYEGQDHITMPYLADDALCEKVVKEYLD